MNNLRLAFRAVTIILYWLFVAAFSFGQSPGRFGSQNPSPIVRVIGSEGQVWAVGTGTVTYDDGSIAVVYTARHVIKDINPQSLQCVLSNGAVAMGTIVAVDPQYDLAAILIQSHRVTPIPVDRFRGGSITIGGWADVHSPLRLVTGRLSPYNYASVNPGLFGVIGVAAREGDSGGPALENGHLIGVLWGADNGSQTGATPETIITSGSPFIAFHNRITAYLADRAKRCTKKVGLTACRGGVCYGPSCYGGACQSCGPSGCGGQCFNGQCSGDCRTITYDDGPPSNYQPPTQPAPVPAPIDLTPITKSVTDLHNELNQFAQEYKPCNCDPNAIKNVQIDINTLKAYVTSLEEKSNAFKSCNCDHSATDKRIDELEQKIHDLEKNNQTPSTTVAPRRFEGVIKRVQ